MDQPSAAPNPDSQGIEILACLASKVDGRQDQREIEPARVCVRFQHHGNDRAEHRLFLRNIITPKYKLSFHPMVFKLRFRRSLVCAWRRQRLGKKYDSSTLTAVSEGKPVGLSMRLSGASQQRSF